MGRKCKLNRICNRRERRSRDNTQERNAYIAKRAGIQSALLVVAADQSVHAEDGVHPVWVLLRHVLAQAFDVLRSVHDAPQDLALVYGEPHHAAVSSHCVSCDAISFRFFAGLLGVELCSQKSGTYRSMGLFRVLTGRHTAGTGEEEGACGRRSLWRSVGLGRRSETLRGNKGFLRSFEPSEAPEGALMPHALMQKHMQ